MQSYRFKLYACLDCVGVDICFFCAQMDVRRAMILITASDMNKVPVITNTKRGLMRFVAIRTSRNDKVTTVHLQDFHGQSLCWSRVRSEDVLLWDSLHKMNTSRQRISH